MACWCSARSGCMLVGIRQTEYHHCLDPHSQPFSMPKPSESTLRNDVSLLLCWQFHRPKPGCQCLVCRARLLHR